MNTYAVFTKTGMIILKADSVKDAKKKYHRNHHGSFKRIKLIRKR